MKKTEGGYTYFVPDLAYHVNKWQRGFKRAINVQGMDHHGTIARVRAGLQALSVGIPTGWPDYVLHKMVTVMKDGEEVKISKRAGSYVTLRDLIDWTGKDAVRFFLISRKADTEFVFDVNLAQEQSENNPVFYVQYAHARICAIQQQSKNLDGLSQEKVCLDLLIQPEELVLMKELANYPDVLTESCRTLSPHMIAFYVRELAQKFHSYYNAHRILVEDKALCVARLQLLKAIQQVLASALDLLGVNAPEKM
jgi:arginyl-tRNA synthetase